MKFEFKNVSGDAVEWFIREMHLPYKSGHPRLILGSPIKVEERADSPKLSLGLQTCTVSYIAVLTYTHVTYGHAVVTKNANSF